MRYYLTPQEFRVLKLLPSGKSYLEIGTILGLAEKTVECYVYNILLSTGFKNRRHLATSFLREPDSFVGVNQRMNKTKITALKIYFLYIEKLTPKQIAKRLNITASQVNNVLRSLRV